MRLSLCMIGRNCASMITAALESARDICDELVFVDDESTEGSADVVAAFWPGATIIRHTDSNRHPQQGWTSDFSVIRNKSFEAATGDAILWLDADDVLVEPQALRELVEKAMFAANNPCDCINLRYDYSHDSAGRCTVRQGRYRVVRAGSFVWEYPVHEDLKPTRSVTMLNAVGVAPFVRHKHRSGDEASAARNLWIMEQYEAKGGRMNDRLWQNIAASMAIVGRHEDSLPYFEKAAAAGGSNPETDYVTLLRWGNSLRACGRSEEARQACARALLLFPDRALAMLCIAEICNDMGHPTKALVWNELAKKVGGDCNGPVWNPVLHEVVPLQVEAHARMALDDIPKAHAAYRKMAEVVPEDKQVAEILASLSEVISDNALYQKFLAVMEAMPNDPDIHRRLAEAAPERLRGYPEIARLCLPPIPAGKPTVAIFCGPAPSPWGPESVETGIGGSEEAVIFLSRELAALGWHVEVYAFPSVAETGYDRHGVLWAPYFAWSEERCPEIYVGWRQFRGDDRAMGAKARYLWLHDKVTPDYFTEAFVATWTGIFCLTEWHAKALPEHARSKLILTKNGLNADYLIEGPNRAHSFISASSPDRGLSEIIDLWPSIRAAIPDATLDVYYGFTANWLNDERRFPDLRTTRLKVEKAARELEGFYFHGMVGQMELAAAFSRCGFWAYPTSWPETSCITSMKAQALGCIPVTSRYQDSGVPETTQYDLGPPARSGMIRGNAVWLEEWRQALVRAATADPDKLATLRQEMKTWARTTFSWRAVAAQWSGLFAPRCSAALPSQDPPKVLEPALP